MSGLVEMTKVETKAMLCTPPAVTYRADLQVIDPSSWGLLEK